MAFHPANERRHYKVTPSLIGWAKTYDQPCIMQNVIDCDTTNRTKTERLRLVDRWGPCSLYHVRNEICMHCRDELFMRSLVCYFGVVSTLLRNSGNRCTHKKHSPLQSRQNERTSKKTSQLCDTGPLYGESTCGESTGDRWIPIARASNAKMSWRHHAWARNHFATPVQTLLPIKFREPSHKRVSLTIHIRWRNCYAFLDIRS